MLRTFIDGAANPETRRSAIGVLLVEDGVQTQLAEPLPTFYDNHEAEFLALQFLLELLLREGKEAETIFCHSDSKMLVDAVHKRYSKKESHDRHLQEVLPLLERFPHFYLKWVPEKYNRGADQLARSALLKNKKKPKKNQ